MSHIPWGAILLLGIQPTEMRSYVHQAITTYVTVTSFRIAPKWKQIISPSTVERIHTCYIHTTEYYIAIKNKTITPNKIVNFKDTMLHKRSLLHDFIQIKVMLREVSMTRLRFGYWLGGCKREASKMLRGAHVYTHLWKFTELHT